MDKLKRTHIHLDLNSFYIQKTDIDKIVFGLFKYATGKNLGPPYVFTANITTDDNSYLGVLKNNNVQLVDEPFTEDVVDILFNNSWKRTAKNQLMLITNMPMFSKIDDSRACVYIDWDNIQVSIDYIKSFIDGLTDFIHNIKVHKKYELYVFLHNKISKNIKEELKKRGLHIIIIIKDKSKSGDEEMLRFIRRNTLPGDSICIASGDRDFSSLMVEYVRSSYNVFLVYNKQAIYTFKHNKHWLGSIDIKSIDGVDSKSSEQSSDQLLKKQQKNKPCKFYNLGVCNTIGCTFLHICGSCGRNHKMQDFHPGVMYIKNTICKKYNSGYCPYTNQTCDFLHICLKCKQQHEYINCKFIVMMCPLCEISMNSNEEFIIHTLSAEHIKKVDVFKKILDVKNAKNAKNHVLVL